MTNRTSLQTLPGVWADAAETDVSMPSAGTSYRDETITPEIVENGQPFAEKVDFSVINQLLQVSTFLLKQLELQGILSYCAETTYSEGSLAMGEDGLVYASLQDDNTNHEPTTETAWWKLFGPQRATTSVEGILALATAAEAQSLSSMASNAKIITPRTLNQSLQGGNQSFASNGYQKLPGGMMIQWGRVYQEGAFLQKNTVSFPIEFSSACINVQLTVSYNTYVSGNMAVYVVPSPSVSGFVIQWDQSASVSADMYCYWLAIGY